MRRSIGRGLPRDLSRGWGWLRLILGEGSACASAVSAAWALCLPAGLLRPHRGWGARGFLTGFSFLVESVFLSPFFSSCVCFTASSHTPPFGDLYRPRDREKPLCPALHPPLSPPADRLMSLRQRLVLAHHVHLPELPQLQQLHVAVGVGGRRRGFVCPRRRRRPPRTGRPRPAAPRRCCRRWRLSAGQRGGHLLRQKMQRDAGQWHLALVWLRRHFTFRLLLAEAGGLAPGPNLLLGLSRAATETSPTASRLVHSYNS